MPIIEDDEEKECEQIPGWIFTYGDLVTLLLVFFILLFSFCKLDIEKFKSVAEAFKPLPPGTPFFNEGNPSVLENIAKRMETSEISEEVYITVDERGVVVSFKDSALFRSGSADILPKGLESLNIFVKYLYAMPNEIIIEGHTDDQPISSRQYPSNWELSSARASSVARFLEDSGVKGTRIQVTGYGPYRPRFHNDTPEKRALNRRMDVILKPD